MGLIDFVKSAGKALGFGDDEPAAPSGPSAEEVQRTHDRRQAAALVRTVEEFGFEVDGLAVSVDGDVATVSGKASSQETREKVVLVVGNTAGIAQVDDRMEVSDQSVFHTVVSGDTLSKIAKGVYGDAMKYPMIFEANKPMLEHPDKIYPGQVLRIPPLGE